MIKIALSFLLLLFILFNLASCSESFRKKKINLNIDTVIYKPGTRELFTGRWDDSLNGMRITFDVVNGKKEGEFKIYYQNGKLQMSGQLKNNRNIGEWKYFYDNGNIESSGNFENDKPEGKWYWYYPDSTLRQTGYFRQGVREGTWKTYDKNGTLIDSFEVASDSTVPGKNPHK